MTADKKRCIILVVTCVRNMRVHRNRDVNLPINVRAIRPRKLLFAGCFCDACDMSPLLGHSNSSADGVYRSIHAMVEGVGDGAI